MIGLCNFARKISIGLLHFAASSKRLHCSIAAVSQLCWKKCETCCSVLPLECNTFFHRWNSSHRYTFGNLFIFCLQRTLKAIARARAEMGLRVPGKLVSKISQTNFEILGIRHQELIFLMILKKCCLMRRKKMVHKVSSKFCNISKAVFAKTTAKGGQILHWNWAKLDWKQHKYWKKSN